MSAGAPGLDFETWDHTTAIELKRVYQSMSNPPLPPNLLSLSSTSSAYRLIAGPETCKLSELTAQIPKLPPFPIFMSIYVSIFEDNIPLKMPHYS
jgi:hypothetical protein